jgi:D-alanine-D-alanine ligase
MKSEFGLRPPIVLVVSRRDGNDESSERDAKRCRAMAEDLGAGGFIAKHVEVADMGELRGAIDRLRPDMAFCSFFRFEGADDRYLRDACIAAGVAWVGSPNDAMELALSKPKMKAHWRLCGIPTPEWLNVWKNPDGSMGGIERLESATDFPYIVKPANEGNSRGIDEGSIVRSPVELFARAVLIAEEYGEALVERFVSGGDGSREFTVAMIGNGSDAIVCPVEIDKPGSAFGVISEDDKEYHATRARRIESEGLRAKVKRLASKMFLSAGVRDYARGDILLHEGTLHAIEINGQPNVPDPWFAACSREAGMGGPQYVNAIALASISGNARTGHAFVSAPRELAAMLPRDVFELLSR